jgi:hypothetical protein
MAWENIERFVAMLKNETDAARAAALRSLLAEQLDKLGVVAVVDGF